MVKDAGNWVKGLPLPFVANQVVLEDHEHNRSWLKLKPCLGFV